MLKTQHGQRSFESNVDGFQDALHQFIEFDPPNNNHVDANFFDFPPEDETNVFGSEVQVEHHHQFQIIQGEQVIGNPNAGVQTHSIISVQNESHFMAFILMVESKSIKEAVERADWITVMQEELAAFDRN